MTNTLDRRVFLQAGLGLGSGLVGYGRSSPSRAQSPVALTMAVWGGKVEVDAYNRLIAKYQAAKPNVTIKLDAVPFAQFYQQIDTRLAGRQAPDVFRVTYPHVGRYATGRAVLDLGPYLGSGYGDAFTPAVWGAINLQGKPFAIPHHTDTFALFYNAEALEKVGVTVPTSLDQAWTWDQFINVAKLLKERSGASYPFAMNWQNSSAHRWLIFLHQHGGRLLSSDLKRAEINTRPGIETIAWTQSWFKDGLVPPSTSVKSSEPVQNLFANGTIPLMLNGNWQIPFIQQQAKFRWGVTYLPRDVAAADDLGGTCLAISRDCRNPEAAADFLKFLAEEAQMREFLSAAQFLPVRTSLVERGLDYELRPDEMKVFVQQTKTIPDALVSTIVHPAWGKFNPRLADELDLAFTSGQSAEQTAANIEAHVKTTLLAS
jgi:multiple sugar transport system substrate-binding protein